MSWISFLTPLGPVTLFEEDDALVAFDWGMAEGGTETALLARAAEQVQDYFDGSRQVFDLPLRPQGTAFQQAVWQAMTRIPFGATRTYGEVATELGSSPRAVGGACGRNPIPVIIPCHRIVGTKGALTGYSGLDGTETKAYLLKLEQR